MFLLATIPFFLLGHNVKHWSFLVIFQQAVKLQRHQAFHHILAAEPRQFLKHPGQVRGYVVLAHLHILQLVGKVEKLFLNDFLSLGHLTAFKFLANVLFYLLELVALTAVDNSD